MNYTPKRTDTPIRGLYAILLILSVVLMSVFKDGRIGLICRVISIFMLAAALYLFIRYDMTTYTYILNSKGTDFEFIINKAVGKRGNYVCFCYMSDCVFFEKRTSNTLNELKNKYPKISFYNFSQNIIKKSDYAIVFKNETGYDCVLFEPDVSFSMTIADAKANAVKCDDGEEPGAENTESTEPQENQENINKSER